MQFSQNLLLRSLLEKVNFSCSKQGGLTYPDLKAIKCSLIFVLFFFLINIICVSSIHGQTCTVNAGIDDIYSAGEDKGPASTFSNLYVDSSVHNLTDFGINNTSQDVYHLMSHGRASALYLDGKWLESKELASWLKSNVFFGSYRHINIYGCEFAKGEKGRAAVSYLEAELGVSIAASDDLTGKDGDWDLEVGEPIASLSFPNYAGNLQGYIDCATILNDDDDGGWNNFSSKIVNGYTYMTFDTKVASGGTSLPVINGDPFVPSSVYGGTDQYLAIFDADCNQILGTYVNGSFIERQGVLDVDASGNVILAGSTNSTDFVTTDGSASGPNNDIFIRKYDLSGTMLFSTVLPTNGDDFPAEVIIDGTDIYITGGAGSTDFLTTDGTTFSGGNNDAFVVKYDCDGNLIYASLIGGTNSDEYNSGVVVNGCFYVEGRTRSTDFPTTDGTTFGGGTFDVFLSKYDAAGNLVFSTLISGSGNENLSVDIVSDGNCVFMVGTTESPNFMTTDGSSHSGLKDVYYRKYDASGTLISSKLYGGSGNDNINSFQYVNGEFFFLMETDNSTFPVVNGLPYFGGQDLYLMKLDANCNLVASTYYGSAASDEAFNMYISATGEVYISMEAKSGIYTTDGTDGPGTGFVKFNSDLSICSASVINVAFLQINKCMEVIGDTLYAINQIMPYDNLDIISTDGTAYSSGTDPTLTKFVFCPPITPIVDDILSPATIQTCANGLVDQIIGIESVIDGSNLPLIYVDGVPQAQPDLELDYLWQVSPSATGPWSDVLGAAATQKNYSPPPTAVNQYYRRLSLGFECCGGAVLSTSTVVCIEIMNNAPTVDLGGTSYTCPGSPVMLGSMATITGGTPPYTYSWNGGLYTVENPIVSPTASTVYTLEVTDAIGCIQVSQATVSVYMADAGEEFSVCDGEGTLIGGTPLMGVPIVPAGGTPPAGEFSVQYAWTPDDGSLSCVDCPNPTATPGVATEYTLTVTIFTPEGTSCQSTDMVEVALYPSPIADFAGPDHVICLGEEICLGDLVPPLSTATLASVTQTSIGNGTATIANLTDGDYSTGGHTLDGATQNITIDLGSLQTINTIDLASLAGNIFDDRLRVEISTDNINFTEVAYYFIGVPATGLTTINFSTSDVQYVRLRSSISFRDVSISEFAASLSYAFIWTPGTYITTLGDKAIFDAGNVDMPYPNPITYTLTASVGTCNYYDQVTVAVIEARAGEDGCGPRLIGEEERTPNVGETFSWTMITDPTITTGTGTFLGATDEDVVPVSASVGGNVGYELTTTYTLNGSTVTCIDTVIVPTCGPSCTVFPLDDGCPDFDDGSPGLIAYAPDGDDISNWNISWTSNEGMVGLDSYTTQVVNLTDNGERTYTVTFTSIVDPTYTCSVSIDVNLPAYSEPTYSAVSPISVCKGDEINIGDPANNPGLTYEWSNAASLDNPAISYPLATVNATTQYTVTVTDMVTGCLVLDTVQVNVLPSANAGLDLVVCDNGVVMIGANTETTGYTFSWDPAMADWRNGSTQFDAMPEVFVAVNQQFILTMVDDAGICTTKDTVDVIVEPLPPPVVLPDLMFCPSQTDPVVLGVDATGTNLIPAGYNYNWTGTVSDPFIANPTVNTPLPTFESTYVVTFAGPNGCNQTAEQKIVPVITMPVTTFPSTICVGGSLFLGDDANPTGANLSYSWTPTMDLSDPTSNNPEFTPTVPGTFTFMVTVEDDSFAPTCVSSSQVTITVLELTPPALTPLTICEGDAVQIGVANDLALQYMWTPSTDLDNPFISNPTFSGTTTTAYNLTIFDANGCMADAYTSVTVNPKPDIEIMQQDEYVCDPAVSSITFSPTITPTGSYSYSWSPSSFLSNPSIVNPDFAIPGDGTYEYVLTLIDQATGCSIKDTLEVVVSYGNCCEEIGGEVYVDANNNGCQDAAETTMVEGATVTLWECDPATGLPTTSVTTTTTAADGTYSFGGGGPDPATGSCLLDPTATYAVEISAPTAAGEAYEDYTLTSGTADAACETAGESDDVDGTTGISSCYDPAGDDDDMNIDAGITPPCEEIGGEVYVDTNNNGCQDATETTMVEGATVTLWECDPATGLPTTSVTTTTTAADGTYSFGGPDPVTGACLLDPTATYAVEISAPTAAGEAYEDYTLTSGTADAACETAGESDDVDGTTGISSCYDPEGDDDDMNVDAGFTPPCEEIGGEVYVDTNNNGCQDAAETTMVEGATVTLWECDPATGLPTTSVTTTTTAADGTYSFGGPDPVTGACLLDPTATYAVEISAPTAAGEAYEDYTLTSGTADAACETAGESDDVDGTTGISSCYDPADPTADNIDAGITPPCEEIGGEVYVDTNNNGCQDAAETTMVEGATVTLWECDPATGLPTTSVTTTTTAADGTYSFGGPDPVTGACLLDPTATYAVEISAPTAAGEAYEDYTLTSGTADAACETAGESDDVDGTTGISSCYDPAGDDDDMNIDAGITPPCEEIGGEVYVDTNNNGCQDAAETTMVEGATVTLWECDPATGLPTTSVTTTTTAADGTYSFGGPDPVTGACLLDPTATYAVEISAPTAAGEAYEDYTLTSGTADAACETAGESDDVDGTTGISSCYDPAGDDDDMNIDAGITPPCEEIGGEVYVDTNNNGCQDAAETTMVEGATVTLWECDPATGLPTTSVTTTTTAADGTYSFGGPDPVTGACLLDPTATYAVEISAPTAAGEAYEDYTLTSGTADAACETAGESDDVDGTTGISSCYDPSGDDDDMNVDAGFTPPCEEIGGEVYVDTNNNGCQDAAETTMVEGATVTLWECDPATGLPTTSVTTTTTAADGTYSFGGPDPVTGACLLDPTATYAVEISAPTAAGEAYEDYTLTSGTADAACETAGESDDVDGTTGISSCYDPSDPTADNIDAGITPPCEEIGGEVYVDTNNNGCQDATETTMVEGATVTLWECDPATGLPTTSVTTTTTAADGTYSFGGPDPVTGACLLDPTATYAVEISAPTAAGEAYEDYTLTSGTADAACVTAGESDDVDGTTGISSCYDPAGDDDDMNIDAGITPPCEEIGGEVYVDTNNNGCQDATETTMVEGATVTLWECDPATGLPTTSVTTTTTAADGTYSFGGPDPVTGVCLLDPTATYAVEISAPTAAGEAYEDYTLTSGTADAACETAGESDDVDGTTGISSCYDPADPTADNIDAGITPPCEEIGGEVYVDTNNNGCQDAAETTMVEGATVTLWECDPATGLPTTSVTTTTTAADGTYSFGGPDPVTGVCLLDPTATYAVEISAPTAAGEAYEDYTLTSGTADAACETAGESDDVDGTTGISSCYDPAGDDDDMNIDAGITPPCEEIGGEVYVDTNNNGCQDATETTMVEGATVTLWECDPATGLPTTSVTTTTTAADGTYSFGGPDPVTGVCLLDPTATYAVEISAPTAAGEAYEDYTLTSGTADAACETAGESDDVDGTTGISSCYDPSGDDDDMNVDAGFTPPCEEIGGEVYVDTNNNGCQDAAETTMVEGATVTLWECDPATGLPTTSVTTTTTAADGTYSFGGPDPVTGVCLLDPTATYAVEISAPTAAGEAYEDYTLTSGTADAACETAGESDDVDGTTGISSCYDPTGDDDDMNIDAGFTPPCEEIGGEVYVDTNNNGCQDAAETTMVEGATVTLWECDPATGLPTTSVTTTTTAADGTYSFGGPDPVTGACLLDPTATYAVEISAPTAAGEAYEDYTLTSGTADAACETAGESDDVDGTTGISSCYDPSGDDDDMNVDAGFTPPCEEIGGEVYVDTNNNGCQDAAETTMVEGATVTLWECDPATGLPTTNVTTTTTAADGTYSFGGPDPVTGACLLDPTATYAVEISAPTAAGEAYEDYTLTSGTADAACETAGESDDVDGTTGISSCYDPAGDDDDMNIDAGITPPCEEIGGEVYVDTNNNGCQDAAETTMVEGATVTLWECDPATGLPTTSVTTTTTAADGTYSFGGPDPVTGACLLDPTATYAVEISAPTAAGEAYEDYTLTSGTADAACETAGESDDVDGTTGISSCYDPSGDDDDMNVDAGFTPPCEEIGGEVYVDTNNNGCQDAAETTMVEGATVTLWECDPMTGMPVSSVTTTMTAADGTYTFGGADPATGACLLDPTITYAVEISAPTAAGEAYEDYTLTSGTADATCIAAGESDDVNGTTGISLCYNPTGDDDDMNIDAGITPPCEEIGGEVFVDTNNNGCQDATETTMVEGATVTLWECDPATGLPTTNVTTTTTAADGTYSFGGPDPVTGACLLDPTATYAVEISAPTAAGEAYEDYTLTSGTADAACETAGESDDVDGTTGISSCYDPSGDDDDMNVDAGFTPPCEEIGGEVYVDTNNNGCQDAAETTMVEGATVTLWECDPMTGMPVSSVTTTMTAADGTYTFGGADPATGACLLDPTITYAVEISAPTAAGEAYEDYTLTSGTADATCIAAGESDDVNGTTGISLCYNPTGDDDDMNIDAGITPPCEEIGGEVFVDTNNNGCQDATETTMVEGATVTLWECDPMTGMPVSSVTTTMTAADGTYTFGGADPATGACLLDPTITYAVEISAPTAAGEAYEDYTLTSGTADAACETAGESDDVDGTTGISSCYDPSGDDDDMNVDAGFTPPCEEIGGEVYVDANNNGCQDAAETTMVEGATVTLWECDPMTGMPVSSVTTTMTAADGTYTFGGADPATGACLLDPTITYAVEISAPTAAGEAYEDYTLTSGTADATCIAAGESDDVNGTTGISLCYNPTGDDDDVNIDAGITPPCEEIGGEVFVDTNNNGCQDAAETTMVEGATVTLWECDPATGLPTTSVTTTTTAADGTYSFGGPDPVTGACLLDPTATYAVEISAPTAAGEAYEDYTLTSGTADATCVTAGESDDVDGTTGISSCYDPAGDDDDMNVDAGFTPPCEEIGGEVYVDTNNNGCQDAAETTMVEGATVTLWECDPMTGMPVSSVTTTMTAADGTYTFGGADPATGACLLDPTITYAVEISAPTAAGEAYEDYTLTSGTADATCIAAGESDDVNGTTGISLCYNPTGDDDDMNIDAGITPPCEEIGGEVFVDTNNNGCQDATETTMVEGATVTLWECDPATGLPTTSVTTTTTAADGTYSFGGPDPVTGACLLDPTATYAVEISAPTAAGEAYEDYTLTSGTADATCVAAGESDDVDGTTGISSCFDPSDPTGDNIDAGITPPCEEIGGEVYVDTNNNGCQDAAETTMVEGATVTLWECDPATGFPTTNVITTTTAADGTYSFGGPDPVTGACLLDPTATYAVEISAPTAAGEAYEDYTLTSGTADAACETAGESDDVDGTTGISSCFDPSDPTGDNIDAGYTPPCETIGGEVYVDTNNNGCQDAAETAMVEGATVTLWECDPATGLPTTNVTTTTTAADGTYSFGGTDPVTGACLLDPTATYAVEISAPTAAGEAYEDYTLTSGTADATCIAAGESDDVNGTTGISLCYNPTGDDDDMNIDAGITPPCEEIGGEVFVDTNNNGCQDATETTMVEGATVTLWECDPATGLPTTNVTTTTTAADGTYSFGGTDPVTGACLLDPTATYAVEISAPTAAGEAYEDYTLTSGTADATCVAAGESDDVDGTTGISSCYDPSDPTGDNIDAGYTPPCETIGGEVYVDTNNNGCQDAAETTMVEGATVTLWECDPATGLPTTNVTTTTTAADGTYSFGGLDPLTGACLLDPTATYAVEISAPTAAGEAYEDYTLTSGTADATCVAAGESDDVDGTTGISSCFDPSDPTADNIDAGYTPPCETIGGEVFVDTDSNGCQDAAETTMVEGATVTLWECDPVTGVPSSTVTTTMTAADGSYSFGGTDPVTGACILDPAATYAVQISAPTAAGEAYEGYSLTTGTADATCVAAGESDDVDGTTGVSSCYDPSDPAADNIDAGITLGCPDPNCHGITITRN